MAYSKIPLFLGLTLALLLIISSDVSARELAQTTNQENAQADVDHYHGYGHGHGHGKGHGHGHRGMPGHGGHPGHAAADEDEAGN